MNGFDRMKDKAVAKRMASEYLGIYESYIQRNKRGLEHSGDSAGIHAVDELSLGKTWVKACNVWLTKAIQILAGVC